MLAYPKNWVFTVDMAVNLTNFPLNAGFRFSPEVAAAMSADSISVSGMQIGQIVRVSMLEGVANERFVSLDLRKDIETVPGMIPELSVIDGVVPDKTVELNEKYEILVPRMIGGTILIQGGCTKRPNYHPTMVHVGHIDRQRDLWSTFKADGGKGMHWITHVVDFELLTDTSD